MTEKPQSCWEMPQEGINRLSVFCQTQLLFLWLVFQLFTVMCLDRNYIEVLSTLNTMKKKQYK